jgi:hypothetical protein
MKLNKKIVDLISEGFKANTLKNMTESQIDILHERITNRKKKEQKEQAGVTQTEKMVKTTRIPRTIAQTQGVDVSNKGMVNIKTDSSGNVVATELSERKKNKKKINPWAVCTSSVGRDDKEKYERCVKDVKRKNKGNLDLGEEEKIKENLFLEKKILTLVEKHIQPKMTKKDFLTVLENEDTKTKEPKVKPGTKTPPKEKPHDPFKPAPHKQPKPKAVRQKDLPQKLKFNSLNIKFKK